LPELSTAVVTASVVRITTIAEVVIVSIVSIVVID
jgi:hypothetical protein